MNREMGEWTDARTDRQRDEWTIERKKWMTIDRLMSEWIDGCPDRGVHDK